MNDIVKPITPQEAFQQKLADKLRDDIGSLIPDEVLAEMVKKAMQEMFFTSRKESDGYGRTNYYPSWFEKAVEELLRDRMRQEIDSYMKKNGEALIEQAATAIAQQAPVILGALFLHAITNSGQSWNFSFTAMVSEVLQKCMRQP